jgi:hypothetical protein
MRRERIIWVIALLLVAGLGFYSGQTIGVREGQQQRAQAAQQFFGQGGGQGGGQAAGQGASGSRGGAGGGLAGTVSNVSGSTITITSRNGQTATVQLAAGATVLKQVDGQLSDVKPGEQIVAFGTQNGNTFQASSIQIGGGQAGSSAQSQ